jgi:hypothetical protein
MDPLMRYVQYQGKTILASKGTFLLKKVLSCELLAIFSHFGLNLKGFSKTPG